MDYRLQLMVGIDLPIPELQLTIHPPTVKDIAYMGEEDFFMALQYLCLDKELLVLDESLLSNMNNFQVMMKVLEQPRGQEKKQIVQTLLLLLFPDYKSILLPSSITLSKKDTTPVMIDSSNFDILQSVVKEALCVNNIFLGDNVVYNPGGPQAKKIADKLMRGRRKAAELKQGNNNNSVLTRYLSILSTAGIDSLNNLINYNLFLLFDQMERYTAMVEWDTDMKIRLAGGKPEKTVETWMRELHTKI